MDFEYIDDSEPYTYVTVEHVYKTGGHTDHDNKNPNFLFDFEVTYSTISSKMDSYFDGNVEKFDKTLEFDKNWLIGGDNDQIQSNVYNILEMIDVPCYRKIVNDLTKAILDLKNPDAISVEKVNVDIVVVTVVMLSSNDDNQEDNVEVAFVVAPANDETVANHLARVVVENDEEYCVICRIRSELSRIWQRLECRVSMCFIVHV